MTSLSRHKLIQLIEGAIFASSSPLSLIKIKQQLLVDYNVNHQQVIDAIGEIESAYQTRAIHLVEVASGYRFQVVEAIASEIAILFQEKAPKYSRAVLETLALIAYRQPITRGEIEDVRGVSVSSHIIKTLFERDWIKEVGHKEVPGRPALLATTKEFLDYFSLKSLAQLPELMPLSESSINDIKIKGTDIVKEDNTQIRETETSTKRNK
ncbi:SMC-Scp complex subunit ScpB [Thalassotalea piscium]|uniref:Segregation and condensation protein B n=1 Tax=Thalassotalea piscium TaxID=1230533 RepID=A0A7X0NIP5_9GAMM|nr:SMC-Scp complex subunit ScpB [Thalassotalea piscium]MBB6544011.1 segregation and condensation protein B [Thalassotalea piscium]